MPPRKKNPSDFDPNHEEYPDSYNYDLIVYLGLSHYKRGEYQQAIDVFDSAIKQRPNDAIGYGHQRRLSPEEEELHTKYAMDVKTQ